MGAKTHAASEQNGTLPPEIIDDRIVETRLMSRSAEQGPGSNAPLSGRRGNGGFLIDTSVEGEWSPRHPSGDPPQIVDIIDGVRCVDAHAMSNTASGALAPALFGSCAAGVVRCESGKAKILMDRDFVRLERCYLQSGATAEDLIVPLGPNELRYRAILVPAAVKASHLVRTLNNKMLAAEAALTSKLSADPRTITLVDGPLRTQPAARRVAGYVKRTANWYLGPKELAIFDDLDVGDRTPLFRLSTAAKPGRDRLTWYMRIADLGPHVLPIASVMRLETWATLGVEQAAKLADELALILPRLAGSRLHDPRAPQNLTPVRGLEDMLHRLLGDREWLRRRIGAALHEQNEQRGAVARDGREPERVVPR